MAEESEKRFQAVMDKLFLPPTSPNSKSTSNPPSTSATTGGLSRGRKRPYSNTMTTTLALAEPKSRGNTIEELRNTSVGTVQSPKCRPWDREDLLKRLATFKSMTWFAKPEVVSAVNCARRGWVNVDLDTIACESCGARLFFSTPSSWAQQHVEKAASVFSLKLNNGHKLLCPWVDNACDEKLAQFPPTAPADLVDSFKKRCAALLQLLELPVISSTAIDYMRGPLLEHFLKCPPTLDECEENSAVLYYQAQKLISLCGWEPRLLPYIVDCKDAHTAVSSAQNASITVYSSHNFKNVETDKHFSNENEQYDHSSVVLDCKLCGAKVGLWAFSTTPRPDEFLRLIGRAEPNNQNGLAGQINNTENEISHTENGEQTAVNKNVLTLTIAGGPLPAEQNFRPTISLPVVGQNLRTRFSSAFDQLENVDGENLNGSDKVLENIETETPVARDLATCFKDVSDTNVVVNDHMHTPGPTVNSSTSYSGKELVQPSSATSMEFNPIKQHRHFCPWIASSGKASPGWKQTLTALGRLKEFAYPSETTQVSSSLIEVEDPVGSVEKLLTPPSSKRKKFTHGSI
ncbi:uncharacterized protein [Rutidosis leptorrhynchoides]|uniref:uncharacterized protein isoform X2 n=1 Tax=Rutidosis leptorrhynchoides TaxID=125765 RepID=UPI003A98F7D3